VLLKYVVAAVVVSTALVGCGGSSSNSRDAETNNAEVNSTSAPDENATQGEGNATSAGSSVSLPNDLCDQFSTVQHELAPGDVLTSYSGRLESVQLQSMTALLSEANPKVTALSGYSCQTTPEGELQDAAVSSSVEVVVISRAISESEALQLTYLGLDQASPVKGLGDWALFDGYGSEGPSLTFERGSLLVQIEGMSETSEGRMVNAAEEVLAILSE
jgi:hypothetical protein